MPVNDKRRQTALNKINKFGVAAIATLTFDGFTIPVNIQHVKSKDGDMLYISCKAFSGITNKNGEYLTPPNQGTELEEFIAKFPVTQKTKSLPIDISACSSGVNILEMYWKDLTSEQKAAWKKYGIHSVKDLTACGYGVKIKDNMYVPYKTRRAKTTVKA